MRIANCVVVSRGGTSNFGSMAESAGSTGVTQMKRRAELGRVKFDRIVARRAASASDRCLSKRRKEDYVGSPGAISGIAGFGCAPGLVWAGCLWWRLNSWGLPRASDFC